MTNFVSSLIGSFLGGGVVAVVIGAFLAHWFSRKLERFKADLGERQSKHDWLRAERARHLVKFYLSISRIRAECSRTIALAEMLQGTGQSPVVGNALDSARLLLREFSESIRSNEALLEPRLVEGLRTFEDKCARIVDGVDLSSLTPGLGIEPAELWKTMREVEPLSDEIQKELRKMLGVLDE